MAYFQKSQSDTQTRKSFRNSRDKILSYTIGNPKEKEAVCAECRKMGISDAEMGWSE